MFIINNFAAAHRHYYIATAFELSLQREKKNMSLYEYTF